MADPSASWEPRLAAAEVRIAEQAAARVVNDKLAATNERLRLEGPQAGRAAGASRGWPVAGSGPGPVVIGRPAGAVLVVRGGPDGRAGAARRVGAGLGPAGTGVGEGRVGVAAASLRLLREGHDRVGARGAARGGGQRLLRAAAVCGGGAAAAGQRGQHADRAGCHRDRGAAGGAGVGRVRRPRERPARRRPGPGRVRRGDEDGAACRAGALWRRVPGQRDPQGPRRGDRGPGGRRPAPAGGAHPLAGTGLLRRGRVAFLRGDRRDRRCSTATPVS